MNEAYRSDALDFGSRGGARLRSSSAVLKCSAVAIAPRLATGAWLRLFGPQKTQTPPATI